MNASHGVLVTMPARAADDPRWAAVVGRDRRADGTFYYSVRTTGVYCRPSCGARLPNPGNVQFHRTASAAEQAGFRPCKRCRPTEAALDKRNAQRIVEICRLIETAAQVPTLAALARKARLSPHHFHRIFKAATGVTPRAYATAVRTRRVHAELKLRPTVTEALYESGFNSGGRFYESSGQMLGMTPTSYRSGGADADIRFAVGDCSLGSILVAHSQTGVCAILLGDDPEALVRDLEDRFPRATLRGGEPGFERLVARVVGFVETPHTGLDLPLDVRGTAFQQRVWEALRRIPAGSTASYSDVAAAVGSPRAVRAVAGACAANPLAVAIPCHRVVRNDGGESGYRWGIERKRRLLQREGAA